MAKSLLRLKAKKLRKKGVSIKRIASLLGVSKSSVSHWVRDIELSPHQLEKLHKSSLSGAELGRIRGALVQKQRRLKLIEDFKNAGVSKLSCLTKNEFLIAGLALYWGEGSKQNKRVAFCNSDPRMIRFLISWLEYCFGVKAENIGCRVGINEIHKKRNIVVKKFWSETIGIPEDKFKKTSFKRVKNKKIYENFDQHYGTLTITVESSAKLYYEIMGLLEGLAENSCKAGSGLVSRGVS